MKIFLHYVLEIRLRKRSQYFLPVYEKVKNTTIDNKAGYCYEIIIGQKKAVDNETCTLSDKCLSTTIIQGLI